MPTSTKAFAAERRAGSAVLAICSIAQFMVVLDVTIMNVALPDMRRALNLGAADQQWIINAYTLTFAGFLMLGARAADLFGRRRVLVVGLVVFTLFNLLGGLAQEGWQVIAARACQGLGGAILAPATLSLLTSSYTEPQARRRALGVWSGTAASGAAAGVLLGGVLTDLLSWRWVFFVNVPIGVLLIAGALIALQESRDSADRGRLDAAGAVTVTAGMTLLVYGIVSTEVHPWGSARTLGTIAAALAVLVAFMVIEARVATNPVVPLAIFRRRALSAANVISSTVGASVFGTYYFLSLELQQVRGDTPLEAGLAFLPIGLLTFGGALVAGRVVHRLGVRRQLTIAPLLSAVGLLWLSDISADSSYAASLLGPLLLIGAGIGLTFVPMTLAATSGVPTHQAGLASGLINASRQLGGAVGLAAVAAIAASTTQGSAAREPLDALSVGYSRAFVVLAAVAAAGALVSFLFLQPEERAAAAPATPGLVAD